MIAGELDLSVGSVLAASSMTLAIVSGHWGGPIDRRHPRSPSPSALVVGLRQRPARDPDQRPVVRRHARHPLRPGRPHPRPVPRHHRHDQRRASSPDPGSKAVFGTLIGGKFEVAIFWWIAVAARASAGCCTSARYGNWIFAVGGDKDSARATGIPVSKVKIAPLHGQRRSAPPSSASSRRSSTTARRSPTASRSSSTPSSPSSSAACCSPAATARSSASSSARLTFAIVNQGIYYTGWNSDWASLILGVLLLAAVLMNNTFRRMALSHAPRNGKKA